MSTRVNIILRWLFFTIVVRPLIVFAMGLNVRRQHLLPKEGPAILVANHNSHLDTFALMTLLPRRLLPKIRPVAAADYFLKRKFRAWFSREIIGIIAIERKVKDAHHDPLESIVESLSRDEIVILFPEGSRGEPEQMQNMKTGIAHLSKRCPNVPVVPVFLHGLGNALPRGEALFVPLICDGYVGESLKWTGDRESFMTRLSEQMEYLADECDQPMWHG